MLRQYITQGWMLQIRGEEERIPAQVPGSVYHDLLCSKRMEDPFWRDNEDKALKLLENDFIYETHFVPDKGLFDTDEIRLCFAGLDTIADVYLNGILLGRADNMHRVWEFSVTEVLRQEENVLKIYFHSPTVYIKERYAQCVTMGSEHCMDGFPQIRKAHCTGGQGFLMRVSGRMFSWRAWRQEDWNPCM